MFPEASDCRQSLELGKHDATTTHKSWPWFLVGMGTVYLAFRTWDMLSMAQFSSQSYTYGESTLPWIGFGVVLTIPFIPASFILPSKGKINPTGEGLDLDCYRTGYVRKARLKNTASLLFGESVALAGYFLLGMIVVSSMY